MFVICPAETNEAPEEWHVLAGLGVKHVAPSGANGFFAVRFYKHVAPIGAERAWR